MVEYRDTPAGLDDRLNATFSALADPTRRAILKRLRSGEATISELAEPFSVSFAAVSKQIATLERARLVERQVVGREHRLRLAEAGMHEAAGWILDHRAIWQSRVDSLESLLRARRRATNTRAGNARPRKPGQK